MEIAVVTAIIGLSVALLGTVLRKDDGAVRPVETKGKRSKSKQIFVEAACMELPDHVLERIAEQLNLVDLHAFGGVCKRWRSVFKANKCAYLNFLPPLAMMRTSFAKRSCIFQDILSGRMYKTKLSDFSQRIWVSTSGGYLVMVKVADGPYFPQTSKKNELSLLNPLTGESHSFWYPLSYLVEKVIVVPLKSKEYLIVANSNRYKCLVFIYPGGHATTKPYGGFPWEIMDIAYFKGRVYVLDNHGRVGYLENGWPRFLEMNSIMFTSPWELHLVSTEDRLMVVDTSLPYKIYRLDLDVMRWEVVSDLGDSSIFLSNGCSGVRNTSMWRGTSNRVYKVVYGNKLDVFSLENETMVCSSITLSNYRGNIAKSLWYLPHDFGCSDCLVEDLDYF